MKRGFLNSTKGKAAIASTASSDSSKAPTGHHILQGHNIANAPFGRLDKVQVPKGFETDLSMVRRLKDAAEYAKADYLWVNMPEVPWTEEPVTECLFVRGTREILLETPGFPQRLPPTPSNGPAFRVAPSPGKGLGLFSTRALKQGEVILTERPLLMTPIAVRTTHPQTFSEAESVQHSLNEFERFAQHAVNRMEDESRRKAFFELQNSHLEDGSGPIVGRIRTNGIGVEGLQPGISGTVGSYSAVCDAISRLNHSCSPNTFAKFSRAMFAFALYAVRDIAEGEELTFSYLEMFPPAAERAKKCLPYAFTCTCRACTPPTQESDARRREILDFNSRSESLCTRWMEDRALPDDWLIKQYLAQLVRLEKEKLQYCEYYCIAMTALMDCYIALGDRRRASKWAARVKRLTWIDYPERYFASLDGLLDPESAAYVKHKMWRTRVGIY
ncbi:SET domain-containing protein [Mycena chlorophos]|uniref:SET domain-containing protein n=1 Tax=Mycena chlorophos TaxID=658473 RepID=A0A8H6SHF3_MYCCL|nr:SET domain-containing protein [Mycena chlorophos]